MGKKHGGPDQIRVTYGKRHSGPDSIKLYYGLKAQRAGFHQTELWEKGTAGRIPSNSIMGKRHSGPHSINLYYG